MLFAQREMGNFAGENYQNNRHMYQNSSSYVYIITELKTQKVNSRIEDGSILIIGRKTLVSYSVVNLNKISILTIHKKYRHIFQKLLNIPKP